MTEPDPDGTGPLASPVTQYAYNAASKLTGVTDPLGKVTSHGYDNLGRLTSSPRRTPTVPGRSPPRYCAGASTPPASS